MTATTNINYITDKFGNYYSPLDVQLLNTMDGTPVLTRFYDEDNKYKTILNNLADSKTYISPLYHDFMKREFTWGLRNFYMYILNSYTSLICGTNWKFLSLEEIYNNSDIYLNMLDIAIRDDGNGCISVMTLDRKTGNYFIRRDRDSIHNDRQMYLDHYVELDTNMINNRFKRFSFEFLFFDMFDDNIQDEDIYDINLLH